MDVGRFCSAVGGKLNDAIKTNDAFEQPYIREELARSLKEYINFGKFEEVVAKGKSLARKRQIEELEKDILLKKKKLDELKSLGQSELKQDLYNDEDDALLTQVDEEMVGSQSNQLIKKP